MAAAERGIPVGAYTTIEDAALYTYTTNRLLIGKQAAQMADQVLKGNAPGDVPVQTAEYALTVNLKIADAIGLTLLDAILSQADTLIR